MKQIYQIIVIF